MKEMVSAAERSLGKLGFRFAKHEGSNVVEFEIAWPDPFLVIISHLAEVEYPSPIFGFILPSRLAECTDLRVEFPVENGLSRQRASEFVRELLGTLKKPPWQGLGIIQSGTAKTMWKRAAEGSY